MNSERDTCTLYSVLMVWLESYGNSAEKLNRHGHVPQRNRISPNILSRGLFWACALALWVLIQRYAEKM